MANVGMEEMIAFIVVFLVGVVPAIFIWVKAWDHWRVVIVDMPNSNESAVQAFMAVMSEAKHIVRVHDDGNNFDASVYNDETLIEAVLRRLSEGIEVRCLFNLEEGRHLKMVERASKEHPSKFLLKVTKDGRPDGDIHGKVADDGVMAYLSSHELGSASRKGRRFDCRSVNTKTRNLALGGYIEWFDQQFEDAA